MALDPIKGAVFMVAMLGFTRSVYKKLEEYAVKKDAKKIYDTRKALYTEIPEHRLLRTGELEEELAELAAVGRELEGFEHLGDYMDIYAPGSLFAENTKAPIRVARSADRIVVALVFRPRGSDVVRIHLLTELEGTDWIVTENNRDHPNAKTVRPAGTETEHLPAWTTPSNLLDAHRKHLAVALAEGRARPVEIDSFDDYVAPHERRWDAIRADRKKNGWVRDGEIAFPPRVKPDARKRIYEEIAKITAFEARRS